MIALPGSHQPDDNDVQTQVTVTGSGPGSTALPPFTARGLNLRGREGRTTRGSVAAFTEPSSQPQQFQAVIDWGDGSGPSAGQVRRTGKGRYSVIGAHIYRGPPGSFTIRVTIRKDAAKRTVEAERAGRACPR